MTLRSDWTRFEVKPLKRVAAIKSSNVDKIVKEGEQTVSLCNYVDVYYNERITDEITFSQGSVTDKEVQKFALRAGDVLITKDSETPDDIAVPALVDASAEGMVCGYHLAMLRPDSAIMRGDFLFWCLKSSPVNDAFSVRAQGITRFGLTLDGIGTVPIPTPDLAQQFRIAAFLDRECGRIDRSIEKKERQRLLLAEEARSAIVEVVTIGLNASAPTRPTGLEWLPVAPAHWQVTRVANLFCEADEPGVDDLPVLSVSIHHGISDRELDDEERDRKALHIADRTNYKRVRPGYLGYNMMRAWQGAVGVSKVDGLVSPAYVVAKPKVKLYSPYFEYLLRTPGCIEEMRRGSKGITSFRLRLYWQNFRQIILVLPPFAEQKKIAELASQIAARADKASEVLFQSIKRLRERRVALITAAVTGQIDAQGVSPNVVAKPDGTRFRVIVGAEIVQRHQGNPKFGRVKNQKIIYLAETHAGITELGGCYLRQAAGPLDRVLISETERGMEVAGFFKATKPDGDGGVTYVPLTKAGQHRAELMSLLGSRAEPLRRLIDLLCELDTRSVEAIATLYAIWNDEMIDGHTPDDDTIIRAVLNDWHNEKREKFKDADLRHWLLWMKRNGLVPKGTGPRTISTTARDMFI